MKQNVLQISVTAAPEEQTDALSAGKMYEHNATALMFTLEESLVLPTYRYYAEFVTVSGTARTEYLTPDAQNQITVDLPIEVTSQMTALCVFTIVQIGDNGKTEQVIKAKTVRLYFSALENTDRLIDENHAFSVNQLLEAIRQNTFKGEKGDKGDAYILTDADRVEIAAKMNEDFYGLPFYKTTRGTGVFTLPGAVDTAGLQSVTVQPSALHTPLEDTLLCIGENVLEPILESSKFSAYEVSGTYGHAYFQLKPNTAYVLAKLRGTMSEKSTSYIQIDKTKYYFCHTYVENLNQSQLEFVTNETGIMILGSSGIISSQSRYQSVLETDWEGLFVGEKATSAVLRKHFEQPLYRANTVYADGFDFLRGETVRKTACVPITADMLDASSEFTLSDGIHTVYRHCIFLPPDCQKAPAVTDGFCAQYALLTQNLNSNSAYKAYVDSTGNSEGIFIGTAGNYLYVFSESTPTEFADALREAEAAGTPWTVLYCRASEMRETQTSLELPPDLNLHSAKICPRYAEADIAYAANISGAFADAEERIRALENRM